jgi:hypothetical protein
MFKKLIPMAVAAALVAPAGAFAQSTDSEMARRTTAASATSAALVDAPLVAFGAVYTPGVKESGTPNWSVVYNSSSSWYEITIVNQNYYYLYYATVVTPLGLSAAAASCKSDSVGGKLLIRCFNPNNLPVQASFSFHTTKY